LVISVPTTPAIFALQAALLHQQVEQLVAVVKTALCVHHLQPVGIAVQRNTVVRLRRVHCGNQRLRVGCTHILVNVHSVGRYSQWY
jgi:hypothetical protein